MTFVRLAAAAVFAGALAVSCGDDASVPESDPAALAAACDQPDEIVRALEMRDRAAIDSELDELVQNARASGRSQLRDAAEAARESGTPLLVEGRDNDYYTEKLAQFMDDLEDVRQACAS